MPKKSVKQKTRVETPYSAKAGGNKAGKKSSKKKGMKY